jgi:hypothetical protein
MPRISRREMTDKLLEVVHSINADTAEKRVPVYTLAEMLPSKNVTALKRLGKLCRIPGFSKMNKSALITGLIEKMTDARILADHLFSLEEHEWELFKRAVKVQQITDDELLSANYRFMLELGLMMLYYHDGHFHYVVPKEIREAFQGMENDGFPAIKERGDLLNNYAIAAANLYGVIDQGDFVALFNSYNDQKTDINEIFDTLLRYVAMGYGYCFWKNYIVNDDFEDDEYESVDSLAAAAASKPRYTPSKLNLLKYADWSYIEETPQLNKLREYVNRLVPKNRDVAEDILKRIYAYGNYEAQPQTYIDIFKDHKIALSPTQLQKLLPLIFELRNNTRLWMNNGHTPNELFAEEKKHLKPLPKQIVRVVKVGRNEPCPCGSGNKYKKCCGR